MRHYPHCPNVECENHKNAPNNASWYKNHGSYKTKINGKQPRFACKKCGRTFGSRTFSLDYYAKKKINYTHLLNLQMAKRSINSMAKLLNCNTETVLNRIRRLSRQF